jgi:hypothetical protein
MQQLRFTIENQEKTTTSLPMPAEQELKLIELMAQAILALLQQPPGGEEDERT